LGEETKENHKLVDLNSYFSQASSCTNACIYGSEVGQEDNPPIVEEAIGSQLEDDE
jgi:hypothetical protein